MKFHEAMNKLAAELEQLGLSCTEVNDWVRSIRDAAGLYRLCDWSIEFPKIKQSSTSSQIVPILLKVHATTPKAPRREHKPFKPIGFEEFERVTKAIDDPVSALVVKVAWHTGVRLREVVTLNVNDVDLANHSIRFAPSKIVVPISCELHQELAKSKYRAKARIELGRRPFFRTADRSCKIRYLPP